MPGSLLDLTAYGLAMEIEGGEVSAREAAEVANTRLEEVEDGVNAFVTATQELALERGEAVDVRNGERALLCYGNPGAGARTRRGGGC